MKIITWNCNGIRARISLIERLINMKQPDIICLQETKLSDDIFPKEKFKLLGYKYLAFRGEKAYNGVACISKIPFEEQGHKKWARKEDCRHIYIKLPNGLIINNFYVPSGGDVPDINVNQKFAHKIKFLSEMNEWAISLPKNRMEILLGDLNIAPLPEDVWSHKQLINVVSHTSDEINSLNKLLLSGNYIDLVRKFYPIPEKLFSWWSYRSRDWKSSNKGRRLDHVWASKALSNNIKNIEILKDIRGWEKPSDHVPILLELEI